MIPYKLLRHIKKAFDEHEWIFAKTMLQNQHWYTLRKTWIDDREFTGIVQAIRRFGYQERFGKRYYTMLDVNDMKYWTMGAPLDQTILINRRYIERPSQYDEVADIYDSLFSDPESESENRAVIKLANPEGRVLDIGCGTGLLLDYADIPKDSYIGIDPSAKMIARFKEKHPDHTVIKTPFESFVDEQYDTILSLFGSANYIEPEMLSRIPEMLNPGGKYFLMLYKPDYHPVCYVRAGIEMKHHKDSHEHLPPDAVISECGNYIIACGAK